MSTLLGCNPGTAARPVPSSEPIASAEAPPAGPTQDQDQAQAQAQAKAEPTAESESTRGVRLEVAGAPPELTVRVQASDDRPPVIKTRPLAPETTLPLDTGFYTITLTAGSDERTVQLYARAGATIDLRWDDPSATKVEGGTLLDLVAAETAWSADTQEMTAVSRSAGDNPALPQELMRKQRAALLAAEESPYAHLLLLRHAWLSAQVGGPEDAWSVLKAVPSDSVAWAATSSWFIELQWFVREVPEATAYLQEVRAKVADPGLQTAFVRGELFAAQKSGDADELAKRTLAATHIDGPPVVGESMPRFELHRLDGGKALRSEALLGTPYLIKVWSTWCAPCIEGMEELHALHERAGQSDPPKLQLISLSIDQTREPVEKFRESQWPMPWTNVWVPGGKPLSEAWSFSGVPYEVLVDAEGTVLAAGAHVSLDAVLP